MPRVGGQGQLVLRLWGLEGGLGLVQSSAPGSCCPLPAGFSEPACLHSGFWDLMHPLEVGAGLAAAKAHARQAVRLRRPFAITVAGGWLGTGYGYGCCQPWSGGLVAAMRVLWRQQIAAGEDCCSTPAAHSSAAAPCQPATPGCICML